MGNWKPPEHILGFHKIQYCQGREPQTRSPIGQTPRWPSVQDHFHHDHHNRHDGHDHHDHYEPHDPHDSHDHYDHHNHHYVLVQQIC